MAMIANANANPKNLNRNVQHNIYIFKIYVPF